MVFAVVSDVVWQALIAAAVTVILGYMQMKTKWAAEKSAGDAAEKVKEVADAAVVTDKKVDKVAIQATKAATKVDEVASALSDQNEQTSNKLDGLAQVARDTHTLVNSNMAVQLKLNAVMSRRLANMPNATDDDKRAAELSEKLFHEHEVKQATVDKAKAENGREKDGAKDR